MEWEEPAIVLDLSAYGEGDAVATLFTAGHGVHRGLARGGAARGRAATWQRGNLVQARWVARLSDQLGSLTAELAHPTAALAMDNRLTLAVLNAACAVTAGALPDRVPHPRSFQTLLTLFADLTGDAVAGLVRYEAGLLAELGYGLDLTRCAATGTHDDLAWVSPKTGRAVCDAAADPWRSRLLRLPRFLRDTVPATAADLRDGLRLTGHFLERDAFGALHKPLPAARLSLYDRMRTMAEQA